MAASISQGSMLTSTPRVVRGQGPSYVCPPCGARAARPVAIVRDAPGPAMPSTEVQNGQGAPVSTSNGYYNTAFSNILPGTPSSSSSKALQGRPSTHRDNRPLLSAIYPRGSVCAVVLGGGENDSRRLFPLTEKRTLPAIPIAGMYRLIDVPLSNLINSGVNKVFVLTQYNSTSLNKYLQHTYDLGVGGVQGDGFLEVVAATQGPKEQRWADGPADAVHQWWSMFEGNAHNRFIEDVLVLPSDQVYKIDFTQLVDFHRQNLADLTIVCRPVEERLVDHYGIAKLTAGAEIQAFEEKPAGDKVMMMSMDLADTADFFQESHLSSVPFLGSSGEGSRTWIGSTGMYLFRKEALDELLKDNPRARDFGREIIPEAIKKGMKVMAYNFSDYWVDIGGSVAEFYEFNMSLAREEIPFSFTDSHAPFYCRADLLPPNQYHGCKLVNTVLGSGCRLEGCNITNAVVGSRAMIGKNTVIEDSVLMGADYYEDEKDWAREIGSHYPHVGIGENCRIKKAIVDKNARIGNGVQLVNREGVYESMDRLSQGIAIRDGVILVSKSAIIPDGTIV